MRMRFDKKLPTPPPPPSSSSSPSPTSTSSPSLTQSSIASDSSTGVGDRRVFTEAEERESATMTSCAAPCPGASVTSTVGHQRMADWVKGALASVPSSMRAKSLPETYTPFPLPRHDDSMGFGPLTLQDVPDVLAAQRRMHAASTITGDNDNGNRNAGDASVPPEYPFMPTEDPLREGVDGDHHPTLQPMMERKARTSFGQQPWSGASTTRRTTTRDPVAALQTALLDDLDEQDVVGTADDFTTNNTTTTSSTTAVTRNVLVHVLGSRADSPGSDSLFSPSPSSSSETSVAAAAAPPYEVVGDDALKVLDRLECRRTTDDLLHQFYTRPQREARTATVLDFAGSLAQRSDAELERMFYELSSLFTAEGNGLQFLVTKVVKFGRPYYVTDELMKAFLVLLEASSEHLTVEAPERLERSPALCIQLLHFLALLRVFEPNRWFSPNPNAPSNRADYSHPRGVNRFTSHRRDGEELFDTIVALVLNSAGPRSRAENRKGSVQGENEERTVEEAVHGGKQSEGAFLRQCSVPQLVELLNGFAAASPEAKPRGDVVDVIWHALAARLSVALRGPPESSASMEQEVQKGSMLNAMERLYLTFAIIGAVEKRKSVLTLLLQMQGEKTAAPAQRHPVNDEGEARVAPKVSVDRPFFGPSFFAAASQEESEEVKWQIIRQHLAPLLHSLQGAHEKAVLSSPSCPAPAAAATALPQHTRAGDEEGRRRSQLYAVVESSQELLMACKDKSEAFGFARAHQYDTHTLQLVPHFERVAERLALEAAEREVGLPTSCFLSARATSTSKVPGVMNGTLSSPEPAHDAASASTPGVAAEGVLDVCTQLAQRTCPRRRSTYLTRYRGKPVHPIRTLLSDLYYMSELQNVFILHSSAIARSVESLLFALRKGRSGKDAVVCSTLFLQALARKAQYDGHGGGSVKVQREERACAARALLILSQEAEKGRVVLLPFTEALLLHDPGVVCSEDLMLWTMSAFFARELPLVKVHTLQHAFSEARQPHHVLKGGHSVLRRHDDLYNRSTPLLAALNSKKLRATTHHVRLQQAVRDPPNRLHKIHPIRLRFLYRRDKALYDRFHVTARHLAPGFAQGALDSDLRGLGFYTPDHPQPAYVPRGTIENRNDL